MELTAPPPKKTKPSADDKKKAAMSQFSKPLQLTPQRRFSHAGFGIQPGQHMEVPKRKISLFHNMKFNPSIMEEQQEQKKEFGLNPNAPSFSMQQYTTQR